MWQILHQESKSRFWYVLHSTLDRYLTAELFIYVVRIQGFQKIQVKTRKIRDSVVLEIFVNHLIRSKIWSQENVEIFSKFKLCSKKK